ncbi:hypothetical protein [Streptomyces sp. G-G2]|uniref:hypothetical protein n=1 Tax=Streptomyces sp. G-G2 TaxID=3046201 RepID=UPI0024BB706A|nr:hypothetical protein [Streptomyces sp. G-G2]MDJ0384883.1 hypothetical protein [Streptomyces sp. G-G2]
MVVFGSIVLGSLVCGLGVPVQVRRLGALGPDGIDLGDATYLQVSVSTQPDGTCSAKATRAG